jgi:hypothetical protein
MKNMISRLAILLVVAWGFGVLACCQGGCPWTKTSEVTVVPETSCLELKLADASGGGDSTGCVNPVLIVKNICTEVLHLPGETAKKGKAVDLKPGGRVLYEVDIASSVEREEGKFYFSIPATLGERKIAIEFQTWLD